MCFVLIPRQVSPCSATQCGFPATLLNPAPSPAKSILSQETTWRDCVHSSLSARSPSNPRSWDMPFPSPLRSSLHQRKLCHLHFPPSVCSLVLIKCLEIKSVAQVPSVHESFPKQIPELSTHPPCNWPPSAFYWIVCKQIKPEREQNRAA